MRLWVGLGNPGARYAGNRHNIGFMAVDAIAAAHGFGPWRARFQGLASEGAIGGEKVLLLKPQTYMNLSGQPVAEALRFHKVPLADLVVFHDEIDLPPARVKVKDGGGHAGHNGLRSIHQHLGDGYRRVRLGVGHPGHKDAVAAYVLHDFAKADQPWLDELMRGLAEGAPALARGDGAGFLNAVALRLHPPRPPKPRPETRPDTGPETQPDRAPDGAPKPAAGAALPADPRTPLQRLADRFR